VKPKKAEVRVDMPLIKKIVKIGKRRGIIFPAEWLRWVKEKYGEIEFVEVEINDELRIRPHVSKDGGDALHE